MELLPTPDRPAPDDRVVAAAVARGLPDAEAGREAVADVVTEENPGRRAAGVTLLAASAGLASRPALADCRSDAFAEVLDGVFELAGESGVTRSAVSALAEDADDVAGTRDAVSSALDGSLVSVLSGDVAGDPFETLTARLGGANWADGPAQVVALHGALGSEAVVATLEAVLDVAVRDALETTLAGARESFADRLRARDDVDAGRPVPEGDVEDVEPIRSGPAADGAALSPRQAWMRSLRGEVARLDGDIAAAHEHYATAVESFEDAGELTAVAVCRTNVASVYRELGEDDAALAQYDGANEQFRGPTVSLDRAAALCTVAIGEAALDGGRIAEAEGYLGRSRTDFEAADDPWGLARSLRALAKTAGRRGSPEEAVEQYRDALSLYERLGDDRGVASVAHELGTIGRESDADVAESPDDRFTTALTAAQRVGAHATAGAVAVSFGELAVERGDDDMARDHFERGLDLFRRAGDWDGEATCLHNLGSLAVDEGNVATARERFEAAHDAFRTAGNEYGAAHAADRLGELARADHPERARERFQMAAETFVRLGAVRDALPALSALVETAIETEAYDLARDQCDTALELIDRADDEERREHFERLRRRVDTATGK